MKKIYISRILKFTALLLPIVIFVLVVQYYFCFYNDPSSSSIHDFNNEEKNSLDVVVMGASDVYSGYSATYAYEKYGFTSYGYSMANNPCSLYKYELKEILKNQDPQLIFVEVEGFLRRDLYDGRDDAGDMSENIMDHTRLRLFTESIPFSLNKLEAIFQFQYEDKLSCLFPFIMYHGNWQNTEELQSCYKVKTTDYDAPTLLKGMFTYTVIDDSVNKYDIHGDSSTDDLLPLAETHLIDFLEYCQEENLDNIVFVRFPHKITTIGQYNYFCRANKVAEIVDQYGYTFLNLEHKVPEIGLDYNIDFYDSDHLNAYGQLKLTDYLGKMIINEYMITPKIQTDANKAHWEKCVTYSDAYFTLAEEYLQSGNETWMFDSLWFMTVLDEKVNNPS